MMLDCATPAGTPALARTAESAWTRPQDTSDVFARRERNASTIDRAMPQRGMVVIALRVGRQTIRISHRGGQELPVWFEPVLESLAERWGGAPGWDGYAAIPTNPVLVTELLNCLQTVMPKRGRAPVITPLADGGAQAEWHKGETALEIVVPSDEPARYYFYDPAGNREEEGAFDGSLEMIHQFIERF